MGKLGMAVVGASIRSEVIFDYLKSNPSQGFITGVYDLIPSRGKYLIEEYQADQAVVYESLGQALEDDRVEAVFIGTPDYAHVEPVTAALKAGKHVYCEKPMAITIEDCESIIDVAKDARSIFYLGMNLRHCPVHEKLHEVLTSGQLGELLTIEANEYYFNGRTYFRRWNRLREFGGGLWLTKACHDFDLLNWVAGGKPTRVFATSNLSYYKPRPDAGTHCRICPIKDKCPDFYDIENPEKTYWHKSWAELARMTEEETGQMQDICLYNSDKDTFDNGIAVVDYNNDVRATYTVNVVSARQTRQMRLMGTEGSAEGDVDDGKVTVWKRYSEDKVVHDLSEQMNSTHNGADVRIFADFFHCCQTGEKPRSSWADGRLSVQLALAARDSADTGSPIEIKDSM